MAERFAAQRGDVDGCVRMCAVGVRRYSLAFQNSRSGSEWHGRTPTAEELAAYEAEGRRQRRVRDLTHAIRDAIERRPQPGGSGAVATRHGLRR